MKKTRILILIAAALTLTGCPSDADRVSQNISTAAEQFEVQRHIVGINGITDTILFEVEGRCSIEIEGNSGGADRLVTTCRHASDDYRKHYLGLSDNVTFVNVQTEGVDADEYRTRIILKPTSIVPNFDLVTGEQVDR